MPIRFEYRRYYSSDWRRLRCVLLEEAGDRCTFCRRGHRLLNLAHLSHDPANREDLAVLCPSCHARHDSRQRLAMTRRTLAARYGQLWLWEELRWAPFPVWAWPGWMRQLPLF